MVGNVMLWWAAPTERDHGIPEVVWYLNRLLTWKHNNIRGELPYEKIYLCYEFNIKSCSITTVSVARKHS